MNRGAGWLGSAGMVLALAACGGGDGAPSPAGDLTASYFAEAPGAGALLLTITGGPVESVTAVNQEQVAFSSPAPGTTRVFVIGNLAIGSLLRIRVPDVSRASAYSIEVNQVADRVSFALISPAAHILTIAR